MEILRLVIARPIGPWQSQARHCEARRAVAISGASLRGPQGRGNLDGGFVQAFMAREEQRRSAIDEAVLVLAALFRHVHRGIGELYQLICSS